MKQTILSLLVFFCAHFAHADPMLEVSLFQAGEDCALTWSLHEAGPNSGLVFYVEGVNQLGSNSYNFLGWFNSQTGSFNGRTGGGWMDFPSSGKDDETGYIPFPTERFAHIFSDGEHGIEAFLLDGVSMPYGYSPDGQYGGSGIWLAASYCVAPLVAVSPATPVPDDGATVWLVATAFLVLLLAGHKRAVFI